MILRLLRRVILFGAAVFVGLTVFVAGFAALQPRFEPSEFRPADVIIVLGAGMTPDGRLHLSSRQRVEKGVALYLQGAAPRLHFSGGMARADGPAAGDQMAKLAIDLGVPPAAISAENASQSTLQNALFSMSALQNSTRLILVTEGFHLPRSWASLQWAALQEGKMFDIALAHSTPFRTASEDLRHNPSSMILRESLAWGFNIARAALWQTAGIFGVSNATRDGWLA